MNRINALFQNSRKKVLSVYFTAGYPDLNNTLEIIRELDKSGVDMIEIGMPFSDPVADGPVIQRSSEQALANGITLNLLFEQLSSIREVTNVPLILMGYINPVFRFGFEKFLRKCRDIGIDGTIIPDLPVEEYIESYESLFAKYNILNIFLLTPQTPVDRIHYIDEISKGFLYIVSTSATTGGTNSFDQSNLNYFRKVNELKLKTPGLIGFGISDKTTYDQASEFSSGVIIGSAFIRALDDQGTLPEKINRFMKIIR